jgi:hypothetical protein
MLESAKTRPAAARVGMFSMFAQEGWGCEQGQDMLLLGWEMLCVRGAMQVCV